MQWQCVECSSRGDSRVIKICTVTISDSGSNCNVAAMVIAVSSMLALALSDAVTMRAM